MLGLQAIPEATPTRVSHPSCQLTHLPSPPALSVVAQPRPVHGYMHDQEFTLFSSGVWKGPQEVSLGVLEEMMTEWLNDT